jgi:RNA polymerase sigma-70 factor (ECF subfamily)
MTTRVNLFAVTIEDDAPVPDALLVERARSTPEAFGQLYARYVRKIYNYVYYRVGDGVEAEDLTSRVFQRASQGLDTYTERGLPFVAWLYRIAHNTVANWYRDEGRRRAFSIDGVRIADWQAPDPEAAVEARSDRELLLAAVRRLPAERQQLLILKFSEQLSNAEIGQVMHRSESAIKSLYHRTLDMLRRELDKLSQDGR